MKLRELQRELDSLHRFGNDPKVAAETERVRKERAPKIAELRKQISELREKKLKEKKPRWPASTPDNVLAACKRYWSGTSESETFRIHCWNDKGVCTSYPSGGYSDNGGWHPTPACFEFISLSANSSGMEHGKPKRIPPELFGRQSQKALEAALEERTKQKEPTLQQ